MAKCLGWQNAEMGHPFQELLPVTSAALGGLILMVVLQSSKKRSPRIITLIHSPELRVTEMFGLDF
jgi:hypothetical protein